MFDAWSDALTVHLLLLILLGLAPLLPVRRRTIGVTAMIGAGLLGTDAYQRELPNVYQVFPWIFLMAGTIAFVVESTTGRRTLAFLGERLHGPGFRIAVALLTLAGLLAVLNLVPLETENVVIRDETLLRNTFDEFQELQPSPLRTDRGRPVRVLVHAEVSPAELEEACRTVQTNQLVETGLQQRVIALDQAWLPCNCHGYIFAGGRYLVPGAEVNTILADNGYSQIDTPRMGDLIVYRDREGQVVHSGVVRGRRSGMVLVESKWGKLGCFLHPHDCVYRSAAPEFYRSGRGGHLLQEVEGSANHGSEQKSFSE